MKTDQATNATQQALGSTEGLGVMVACSKGVRLVAPGMRWRDLMTGSEWEVVEPAGSRVYSPSGFGGTPEFWCRAVGDMPLHATRYAEHAREDGCVAFCGDSIAAMLLTPNVRGDAGA